MILISDVDLDLLNELHTYGSVRNLKDSRNDLYEVRMKKYQNRKRSLKYSRDRFHRAANETRTRDPQLGKQMLNQLSYYRSFSFLITGTNVEVFFLLYKLLPYFYHIEKS